MAIISVACYEEMFSILPKTKKNNRVPLLASFFFNRLSISATSLVQLKHLSYSALVFCTFSMKRSSETSLATAPVQINDEAIIFSSIVSFRWITARRRSFFVVPVSEVHSRSHRDIVRALPLPRIVLW